MSVSKTGATAPVNYLDLDVVKRVDTISKEIEQEIEEWKDEIKKVLDMDEDEIGQLKRKREKLSEKDPSPEQQEELEMIDLQINYLKKREISSYKTDKKKDKILQSKVTDQMTEYCPFCGKKAHLDLDKEESDSIKTASKRENQYKKNAENQAELMEDLQKNFDEKKLNEIKEATGCLVTKDMLNCQSHHIVSVQPYSYSMRVSSMFNVIGFNINSPENCIALPSIDTTKFNELNAVKWADLDDTKKYEITSQMMESTGQQFHLGRHLFEPPGKDTYELKLSKMINEFEKENMEKIQGLCDENVSPEERKKEISKLKEDFMKNAEKIREDLNVEIPQDAGKREYFVTSDGHKYSQQVDKK